MILPTVAPSLINNVSNKSGQQPTAPRRLVSAAFAGVLVQASSQAPRVCIKCSERTESLSLGWLPNQHDGTWHEKVWNLLPDGDPASPASQRHINMCTSCPKQGATGSQNNKLKVSGTFQGMVYLLCWFLATAFQQRKDFWRTALKHHWLVSPSVPLDVQNFLFATQSCAPRPGPHTSCAQHTRAVWRRRGQGK